MTDEKLQELPYYVYSYMYYAKRKPQDLPVDCKKWKAKGPLGNYGAKTGCVEF